MYLLTANKCWLKMREYKSLSNNGEIFERKLDQTRRVLNSQPTLSREESGVDTGIGI